MFQYQCYNCLTPSRDQNNRIEWYFLDEENKEEKKQIMVVILVGNSDHLNKRLKHIKLQISLQRAHIFLSYHVI